MFDEAKYVQNSFNLVFPRQPEIRRKANDFEDSLRGRYVQPQIIAVPDELDPEVPRIIFGSQHGFSQVIISQVNLVLNVTYSPDWQTDISKGRQYLLERTSVLYDLLEVLGEVRPLFCGLTTRARLRTSQREAAVLKALADLFMKSLPKPRPFDIEVKTVTAHSGRFFSNMMVRNYCKWNMDARQIAVPRFPRGQCSERGIEVIGDFNDRYAYNEHTDYHSSREVAPKVIEGGLREMKTMIEKIRGARS